jgi:xanthine permease XanP
MTSAPDQPERPSNLLYAVDEWPPPLRLVLLGFQYAVMAAIYLILVAIILRHAHVTEASRVDAMGIACFGLAVGTTLQALPRGPVGSGFLAPPVFSAVYLAPSVLAAQIGGLPLVFGMTLLAGVVEVLGALLLNRLRTVITPVLSGLTVFVVGLQLGVVGIGETLDVHHEALPAFPLHLVVTTLTLMVCVGLSIWGRGTLKLLCSSLGLTVGMVAASVIGLIDPTKLAILGHSSWIALPRPTFLQLEFDAGLMPAFLAAGIAAALRAVGVITTCQRINNAAWRRPDRANIRKGVLADGLSNVVGSVLGVPGMSIGPSLVGVSGATGATSRVIGFAASVVLLVFAFSPKLSGFFLLVPQEVAGSLLVFTASFMISGGMQVMLSRPVDTRAVFVIGVSTLLALSENVFPGYYHGLPAAVRSFTGSPLALCLTAAIALTLLFRLGARQTGEIVWNQAEESIASAVAFVRSKAQGWKIAADLVETSAGHSREVITYILENHLRHPEGALRITYNGVELRLEILYQGTQTAHLPLSREGQAPVENALDDEEAAAYVGLRNFLRGLAVDRQQVKVQEGRVKVRLSYAV